MSSPNNEIKIINNTVSSEESIRVFSDFIRQLATGLLQDNIAYLKEIQIISTGSMETSIQKIAEEGQGSGLIRHAPKRMTELEGAAIPVILNNKRQVVLLYHENILRTFSSVQERDPAAISTIVEEVLHVYVHAKRWNQGEANTYQHCLKYLEPLVSMMYDECGVSAYKNWFFGMHPVGFKDEEPQYISLSYGESIADHLTQFEQVLKTSINGVVNNKFSAQTGFSQVQESLYRDFLEPLGRNTGFSLARPDIEHPFNDAEQSAFFRTHLKKHWLKIEVLLNTSIVNDLQEIHKTTAEIVNEVVEMLGSLGISFRKTQDNGCWVNLIGILLPA